MAHLNGELFHWKKLRRVEVDCPFCHANEFSVYERYGEEYQYSNVQCKKCRFIYQNPRFEYNQEFLDWAYTWYGDTFITETREKSFEEILQSALPYFEFKKNLIDKWVSLKPYRLVDVGCACGQFLSHCHGKDCVGFGVETSRTQVQFIRDHLGIETFCGTTGDMKNFQHIFDVTHMAHTLEHVPNPLETLDELISITKPGGILFIEVPNVASLKNYFDHLCARWGLRKNTWKPGDFPEHMVEFTTDTLRKVMKKKGLEILHFQCHSRSVLRKTNWAKAMDRWVNGMLPVSNNLICVARVFEAQVQ